MKFVCFERDGTRRLGILTAREVVDLWSLGASHALPQAARSDLAALIRSGRAALDAVRELAETAPPEARLPLSDVSILAPLLPSTILCAGSNYHDHNSEKAGTPISGTEPEFFVKTSDCVIGPNAAILFDPILTRKLDCETELAVVIGKSGRHIPVERALEHVFGYTIVNDVTARDRQVRTSPTGFTWYELGRGKAFDTSAPLGPVVVTADEIGDPQALALRTRINGELRQSASTADMIWTCAELVHFFSINFELRPGMVIITGTPAGTAWSTDGELGGRWKAQPGLVPAKRYCFPGDVIECEIDGIGTLVNHVSAA
ncbi:fumarylacetoacetate hydrolase family protein [Xanthobacter sp. KR7-65]|uniref:fumarylacetoacetate hydrolase family protein n=1 Tax=Xanthobacter sp. KR7-65 TaxID=3156612 RepID=UPI0032B61AD0